MLIDWDHFTPWSSLAGGLLIGLAASALLLINGRVFGISGIVGGLFRPKSDDTGWRLALVFGLICAPILWSLFLPEPVLIIDSNETALVIAGLLVGFGTRYGSGCTSGHGVCGLSRLSPRSLAATVTFMAAGFTTVYLIRHVL